MYMNPSTVDGSFTFNSTIPGGENKALCDPSFPEDPYPEANPATNPGEVLPSVVDWCDFHARLRQAAREAANLRMIYGQEFKVDALGVNFSGTVFGGEAFVEDVGPYASGIAGSQNDPNQLLIQSLRYDHTTQSGQQIQRQFQMLGLVNDGVYTGEYRETVWGFGAEPTTVVGSFALTVEETVVSVPTSVTAGAFSAEIPPFALIILTAVAILC